MSRKTLTAFCLGSSLLVLAGCQGGGSHDRVGYDGAASWGNYKCHAARASGGSASVGWASTESQARTNALDKCKAHNQGAADCKVTDCGNDI